MSEFDSILYQRRSSRSYTGEEIPSELILSIIDAGLHAPSGKNGQPWKFTVVHKDKTLLREISKLTLYDYFVKTADALIVVFLDKTQSYHYIKDVQAIGACIQNILLKATNLGIGTCWIGEILNRDSFVKKRLNINNSLDLMAVITLGYPNATSAKPAKKELSECLLDIL